MIAASALHHVDVLNRDGAAVAEVDDEDGKPDGRLGGRHGQHEQREDLPDDVAHEGREGDEVDVDREQDELDRHQDDDDVLAVDEDAEHAEGEQHGGDGEIMREPDGHVCLSGLTHTPSRKGTFRTSMAVSRVRATCCAMSWRLTPGLWRSVRTMAPIMATSSTRPDAWKK